MLSFHNKYSYKIEVKSDRNRSALLDLCRSTIRHWCGVTVSQNMEANDIKNNIVGY